MQARKSTAVPGQPLRSLPPPPEDSDPRERFAPAAARPTVPLPRSERLAGPFRVKPSSSYLERRAWPFCGQ